MLLKAARGFMLMEVLVALVLTALGIAAWLQGQASALQQTRTNQHRTLAMLLASDMAEILRASPGQAAAMDHAGSFPAELGSALSACRLSSCDAPAWAVSELAQWRERVSQSLPEGSSRIRIDSLQRSARITLAWREDTGRALPAARPSYLQCPPEWGLRSDDRVQCLGVEVAW